MAVTGYSRGWIYEASLGLQPFRTWISWRSTLQKYRCWSSAEWCGTSDGCGKSYSSHPPMAGCGMVVKWPTGWVNSRVKRSVVNEVGNISSPWTFDWEFLVPNTRNQIFSNKRNGKKNLRRFVLKIKKEHPESDVEVWSMDEHRLGLKPILRREGVDEFSNANAVVNWRFQWLWLYGFVHPSTGETYWWILPFVNSQLFDRVLKDFALQ